MKIFRIGDKAYHLDHNNSDDCRYVREIGTNEIKLKFDWKLNVQTPDGKTTIARLHSIGEWENGSWAMDKDGVETVLCDNKGSWRDIVNAEVAASIILLS